MADRHIFKAISPEGELIEIQVEVPVRAIRRREMRESAKIKIVNAVKSLKNTILTYLFLFLSKLFAGLRFLYNTILGSIFSVVGGVVRKIKSMAVNLEGSKILEDILFASPALSIFFIIVVLPVAAVVLFGCLRLSLEILNLPIYEDEKTDFIFASEREAVEILARGKTGREVEIKSLVEVKGAIVRHQQLIESVAEQRRIEKWQRIHRAIEDTVIMTENIAREKDEEDRRKKEEEEKNRPIVIAKSFEQAVLGYFLGDRDLAKNIDRCIELDPGNPTLYGWRILIRSKFTWKDERKNDPNIEKEGYLRTLTANPQNPEEYFAQGVSYFRLKSNRNYYQAAIEDFNKCRRYYVEYTGDRIGLDDKESVDVPICYYFLYLAYSKLGDTEAADYNLGKFKVLEQRARIEIIRHKYKKKSAELRNIRKQNGKGLTKLEKGVLTRAEKCLIGESRCDFEEIIKTIDRTGKLVTQYLGWMLFYHDALVYYTTGDDLREMLVAILSRQKNSQALQYLVQEIMWHDNDSNRELIIKVLVERENAEGLIKIALYANSPEVRRSAIEALQKEPFIDEESVRNALHKVLMFDEYEDNRKLAQKILEEYERKRLELESQKQLEEEGKIPEAAKITEQQKLSGVNEKMMPQADQGADLKTKKAQGIGLESSVGGDGVVIENVAWDHIQRAFLFCLKSSSGKSVDFDHGTLKIKGSIYRIDYPYKFSTSSFDNVMVNGCIIPTADFQQATWNHQEGRLVISLINYRHLFDGVSKIEYIVYDKKGHPFITLTAIPELQPCSKGETTTHTGYIICL